MAKKQRRQFDAKELEQIETMAAMRVPKRVMAALMGLTEDYFTQLSKKDDALRLALENGQAKGSAKAWNSLYEVAVIKQDPTMLKFWMKTQEGVREVDRMELTGKDGTPLIPEGMTPEQRKKRITQLNKHMEITENGKRISKKPARNSEG